MLTHQYGERADQLCDVFSRKEQNPKAGVVIVIHGGAWIFGDRRDMHSICEYLSDKTGCYTVSVEYALSQFDRDDLQKAVLVELIVLFSLMVLVRRQVMKWVFFTLCVFLIVLTSTIALFYEPEVCHTHPQHVKDIAQCISWIRKQKVFPCNKDSIFLVGHSAGAHLAALVSLNLRFLRELEIPVSCLRGVVCISGVFSFFRVQESFVKWLLNRSVFNDRAGNFSEQQLRALSCTPDNYKEFDRWNWIVDAWPIFHDHQITSQTPPFLLLTAGLDLSLLKHAQDFQTVLKKAGVHVQRAHFDATTHFSIRKKWESTNYEVGETVSDFISIICQHTPPFA